MQFEIKKADNGYIFMLKEADLGETLVFQELHEDRIDCFADFLRTILDNYGPTDSRYSEKRIYITVEHGDKYLCPNKPCEYCGD